MLAQIEMLFGSIGVTLSIFFCITLINRKHRAIRNVFLIVYFLTFGIRVGKSLFHNYFEISEPLRTYYLSLLFCVGPSLWLFTKYFVCSKKELSKYEILHYGIFILLLPVCWLIPNNGNGSLVFYAFYQATIIHMAGYILYAIFWFQKNKRVVNLEDNKVHTFWMSFLCANIIIVGLYSLISLEILPYYLGLSFSFTIVIIIFGCWGLKLPQLISPLAEKYQSSQFSTQHMSAVYQKLNTLMESEKLYLNPTINLSDLSQQIGVSPKELSQAINQISKLNYTQYISRLRIEEAKRRLVNPDSAHHKIASVAFDCGFESISSFNSHFKKYTSVTAKEYRNTQK